MIGTDYEDSRGRMWKVIALSIDTVLNYESRCLLWGHVLDRYYDFQENGHKELKKGAVRVKETDFEALIKSDGRYMTLGCFGGRIFEGTVESSRGKSKLSFLVCEPINVERN